MKKVFKIILYILAGLLLLLAIAVAWLVSPSGKRTVRTQIVAFLEKKLETEVQIGRLDYSFPKMIELGDVFFRDRDKDTMLYAGHLKVDISMLALLKKKIMVSQLILSDVNAHIYRKAPDTAFNFTYVIQAFAGKQDPDEPAKTKDTTAPGFTFDVGKVRLENIRFRFDDETGGSRLAVQLKKISLSMRELNPGSMVFRIKKLEVEGLATSFRQDTSYIVNTDTSSSTLPQLSADELSLKDITFRFERTTDPFLLDLQLGSLLTHPKTVDLNNQQIAVDDLNLSNTSAKVVIGKSKSAALAAPDMDSVPSKPWTITVGQLNLEGIGFAMSDEQKPRQKKGIDYAHLDVQDLALSAGNIYYSTDSISGNIAHLALAEQSGLQLQELKTDFVYHQHGAALRNLFVQTPNTILRDQIVISYDSLGAVQMNAGAMAIDVSLKNSIVGFKDLLIFSPQLQTQPFIKRNRNARAWLDTRITGTVGNMAIQQLQLRGIGNTLVDVSGRLSGLPVAERLRYDFNIRKLKSSRNDIESMLPPDVLASLRLPDIFGVEGKASGSIKDYTMNLSLMSSDGHASLAGYVKMSPGKGREAYDIFVRTYDLNIGRILRKDTLLGPVSAKLTLKGHSFDFKTMDAVSDGVVYAAYVQGYNYQQISWSGKVAAQQGDLHLLSDDPNAKLEVTGTASFKEEYPAIAATIRVDSANMQALGLYKDPMKIQTTVRADIDRLHPGYPDGAVSIYQSTIAVANKTYQPDSMYVVSRPGGDSVQHIDLNLDILRGALTGHIPLTKIAPFIQEHVNRHYGILPANQVNIAATDTNYLFKPLEYDFRLEAVVQDKPHLYSLIPGLQRLDTIKIMASANTSTMQVSVDAPSIVYKDQHLDQLKVDINERDSALTYGISIARLTSGNIRLLNTNLEGNVGPQQVIADLTIDDEDKKQRFALSAIYRQEGQTGSLQIGSGMKLNYREWTVAQPNRIVFGSDGFYVEGLSLTSLGSEISVSSREQRPNAPLTASISNFQLADITQIFSDDTTLLASGVLNATIDVQQLEPRLNVKADATVSDLAVLNDTVGNLKAAVHTADANMLDANIALTERGNDVSITGQYFIKPQDGNNFDIDADINALSIASVEKLLQQLRNSSGYVRGQLSVKGTTKKPQINGELRTDNLATTIGMLNTPLKMPSERIVFDASGIRFDDFTMIDTVGNKATVDGVVTTNHFPALGLDLRIRANEWHALNSSARDNKLFYGNLVLTTNLTVKGTLTAPDVNGTLNILKGTKMTVVLPENNPGLESSEGIVEFIDRNPQRLKVYIPVDSDTVQLLTFSKSSDINVNIGIDDDAEFSVVIDAASGDFLRVRGEANLNASVSPGGELALTGIYELKEGAYELNYNLIKRRFLIQNGSTIVFSGDPLKSEINLTAIYKANVSPYDLVERMIADQAQLNYYRQMIPFEIELMMKGPLMKPFLFFNIDLPQNTAIRLPSEGVEMVQGRLTQLRTDTSELNKQVFAILILNRFITDDPLGGGGPGLAFTAKQSVSRFIGEQLNQVASQLVSGVDLSVDLTSTEDYTSGQRAERTDLNIAASKRLLDDRLKITVGNNFELEGPQSNTKQQNSSLIPGNLAADYNLTADGRYAVRAYRVTQDRGVLQGFVTETGLNFIVSLDYNKFWNLFRKKKNRRPPAEKTTTTDSTATKVTQG